MLGSLTATLLVSTLIAIPSGEAQQVDPTPTVQTADSSDSAPGEISAYTSVTPLASESDGSSHIKSPFSTKSDSSNSIEVLQGRSSSAAMSEPVKLGEQAPPQSQTAARLPESITKIHAHELSGRPAATLYIHNIPVLTFVGEAKATSEELKQGEQVVDQSVTSQHRGGAEAPPSTVDTLLDVSYGLSQVTAETIDNDPLWQASALATRVNQLHREGVDASKIVVSWRAAEKGAVTSGDRYVIQLESTVLATIDDRTILPDATSNREQDALTAANRLRRLMGDAEPLSEVLGKPKPAAPRIAAVSRVLYQLSGLASWYGPGFHGNLSASGEVYNQHAMTAAHPSLPFGTQVRVTNLDNGRSVIVRINDRGPYYGGRIIDLSTAAAQVIGMVHTGVARVRVDVLR
jgi:rare lipoprotein A